MNTMDALRLSVIETNLIKAQDHAAKMELLLEGFIQLRKISPVTAPIARLISMATAYESVASRIRQIATATENELKDILDENERHVPKQVPQG